jgi:two-component system sensor histidine kinase/response regulator
MPGLLARLMALLAEDDADAVALFQQHRQSLNAALGEAASVISEAMTQFRFPDALAHLHEARAARPDLFQTE